MNLDSQYFEVTATQELGICDLEHHGALHGVIEYC